VMIAYLGRLKKSPEIQLALNTETEGRGNGYRKFVEVSRENPVSKFAAKP